MSDLSPIKLAHQSSHELKIIKSPAPEDRNDDSKINSEDENCFHEQAFLNLSENILTYGRISISTPSKDTVEDEEVPVDRIFGSHSTGNNNNISFQTTNFEEENPSINITINAVKTPAKFSVACIVPKSNKAQRLRREALVKKMEKTEALVAKVSCLRYAFVKIYARTFLYVTLYIFMVNIHIVNSREKYTDQITEHLSVQFCCETSTGLTSNASSSHNIYAFSSIHSDPKTVSSSCV